MPSGTVQDVRRRRSAALGLAAASLLAAGALVTGAVAEGAPAAGSSAAAPSSPVKLRLYYNESGPAEKLLLQAVAEFSQAHPGVQVEAESVLAGGAGGGWIDQLLTRIATNTSVPDVYLMEKNKALILLTRDRMLPLDPFISRDRLDLSDIAPPALAEGRYRGQLYGLPARVDPILFYANLDRLAQVGLNRPGNQWTLDDLRDAARKMTADTNGDGQPDVWGADISASKWTFPAWLPLFGGSIMDPAAEKVTLDQPPAFNALQFLVDLVHGYNVAPNPMQTDPAGIFLTGNVGLGSHYSFYLINLRANARFSWDVLPLPRGPAGPGNIILGNLYMIDRETKHPDLAWELVRYLAGADVQRRFAAEVGSLFARRSFLLPGGVYHATDPQRNWAAILDAYNTSTSYPPLAKLDQVRSILNAQVANAFNRKVSPRQALEAAAAAIRAELQR